MEVAVTKPEKFKPQWAKDIIEARKKKGLTQSGLAQAIKVSQSTITDWERGKSRPSGENLTILKNFLGLSYFGHDGFYQEAIKGINLGLPLTETPFEQANQREQIDIFFYALFFMVEKIIERKFPVSFSRVAAQGMRSWVRFHDPIRDRRLGRPLAECLDKDIEQIAKAEYAKAEDDACARTMTHDEYWTWREARRKKNTGDS
ncbi:hypothetical protein DB34_11415 [Acetobacter pasteurianus]|nr:hypothetical protein DB34_11415 [Acetobacter pasteurianus]